MYIYTYDIMYIHVYIGHTLALAVLYASCSVDSGRVGCARWSRYAEADRVHGKGRDRTEARSACAWTVHPAPSGPDHERESSSSPTYGSYSPQSSRRL